MTMPRTLIAPLAALMLVACGSAPVAPPSPGHLRADVAPAAAARGEIPAPVMTTTALPRPAPTPKVETYSVVVNNVRVHELLFALARDAAANVDIHPGIEGMVTLNAIDQTLPQLLTRIARQVDMRWEIDGNNLSVMPDTPYLQTYKIDYVNMSRDTSGMMTVTTQVASTPGAVGTPAMAAGSGAGSNNSQTRIDNKVQHHFWETLEKNIKDILRETDKILPEGSSETVVERADQQATTGTGAQPPTGARAAAALAGQGIAGSPNPATLHQSGTTVVRRTTFREAASVIANPETGIAIVRATSRQHEKIREFLDQVMAAARRQVLIEATVAEVSLSDSYQQGIDWSALPLGRSGFRLIQKAAGGIAAPASSIIELGYLNQASSVGNISASVKLLDAFGTVKVLSSPKLSVLNNQTAVLKVVDNLVYFTIKADTTTTANVGTTTTYTTNLNSVPVGLVMNVTPQISDNDAVLLNVRPSISRKFGEVIDPNPDLQKLGVKNAIPLIRTREMESMIRLQNGNIAVMGGLMEDSLDNTDHAVPGAAGLPVIGNLFQNRDDTRRKTELVVFLRPIVVKDASIDGDYAAYRGKLPGQDFFDRNPGAAGRLAAPRGESMP